MCESRISRDVSSASDDSSLSIPVGLCAAFAGPTSQEDIIFAVFNSP
jgi:hypothetical protein